MRPSSTFQEFRRLDLLSGREERVDDGLCERKVASDFTVLAVKNSISGEAFDQVTAGALTLGANNCGQCFESGTDNAVGRATGSASKIAFAIALFPFFRYRPLKRKRAVR
jgi:hypothetical protein